jgi:hypothetical protein
MLKPVFCVQQGMGMSHTRLFSLVEASVKLGGGYKSGSCTRKCLQALQEFQL